MSRPSACIASRSTAGRCRTTCFPPAGPPIGTGCLPTPMTWWSLLGPGENVIAGVLGDGWYRGRLGWDRDGDRGRYGSRIGLIAQLEVHLGDGTTRTGRDGSVVGPHRRQRSSRRISMTGR